MSVATLPQVRGKLTPNAPLAPLVWFKSGGTAEHLFEPADEQDLVQLVRSKHLRQLGRMPDPVTVDAPTTTIEIAAGALEDLACHDEVS